MKNARLLFASVRLGVLASTCLPLMGCFHMNHFASEATDFNGQVAASQDQTLLLNVIRAANRYPMHFTELSTLSGTGTLTAGGTLTVPFSSGTGMFGAAPTAMVTETPTFNIAVLETQEFYRGMLAPITTDELSTYLQEGLESELVLSLGIGALLYQSAPNADAVVILNDFHPLNGDIANLCPDQFADTANGADKPKDPINPQASQYACFKSILRAMIDRGLTTESVKSATNIGGLITQSSFNDMKWLNGLDPKVFKVTAVDAIACTKKTDSCPEGLDPKDGLSKDLVDRLANHERLYRVQNESKDFRFCFNEAPEKDNPKYWRRDRRVPLGVSGLAAKIAVAHIPPGLICHDRVPDDFKAGDDLTPDPKCNSKVDPANCLKVNPPQIKRGGKSFTFQLSLADTFTLEVQPRSTEGVIYYLGEIARCNVRIDSYSVCTKPTIHVAYRGKPDDEALFAVSRTKLSTPHRNPNSENGQISADWGDYRYSVLMDPTGMNRSGQVLRVLTQLLALNRSSKDFPTPSIVPIISH